MRASSAATRQTIGSVVGVDTAAHEYAVQTHVPVDTNEQKATGMLFPDTKYEQIPCASGPVNSTSAAEPFAAISHWSEANPGVGVEVATAGGGGAPWPDDCSGGADGADPPQAANSPLIARNTHDVAITRAERDAAEIIVPLVIGHMRRHTGCERRARSRAHRPGGCGAPGFQSQA